MASHQGACVTGTQAWTTATASLPLVHGGAARLDEWGLGAQSLMALAGVVTTTNLRICERSGCCSFHLSRARRRARRRYRPAASGSIQSSAPPGTRSPCWTGCGSRNRRCPRLYGLDNSDVVLAVDSASDQQ